MREAEACYMLKLISAWQVYLLKFYEQNAQAVVVRQRIQCWLIGWLAGNDFTVVAGRLGNIENANSQNTKLQNAQNHEIQKVRNSQILEVGLLEKQ